MLDGEIKHNHLSGFFFKSLNMHVQNGFITQNRLKSNEHVILLFYFQTKNSFKLKTFVK